MAREKEETNKGELQIAKRELIVRLQSAPEQMPDFVPFPEETAEALAKVRLPMFDLTREPITNLDQDMILSEGNESYRKAVPLLALQAAIFPDNMFREGTNNMTLKEQLDYASVIEESLGIQGAGVIIAEASQGMQIFIQHQQRKGKRDLMGAYPLFGGKGDIRCSRTITPVGDGTRTVILSNPTILGKVNIGEAFADGRYPGTFPFYMVVPKEVVDFYNRAIHLSTKAA